MNNDVPVGRVAQKTATLQTGDDNEPLPRMNKLRRRLTDGYNGRVGDPRQIRDRYRTQRRQVTVPDWRPILHLRLSAKHVKIAPRNKASRCRRSYRRRSGRGEV